MKSEIATVIERIAIMTTTRFWGAILSVYPTEMLSKNPKRIPVNVINSELSRIIAL